MPHPIALDISLDVNAKIIETTNPRALKIHQGKAARSAAFFCCSGSNSSRFAQYIQKTIEKSAERKKSIGNYKLLSAYVSDVCYFLRDFLDKML